MNKKEKLGSVDKFCVFLSQRIEQLETVKGPIASAALGAYKESLELIKKLERNPDLSAEECLNPPNRTYKLELKTKKNNLTAAMESKDQKFILWIKDILSNRSYPNDAATNELEITLHYYDDPN